MKNISDVVYLYMEKNNKSIGRFAACKSKPPADVRVRSITLKNGSGEAQNETGPLKGRRVTKITMKTTQRDSFPAQTERKKAMKKQMLVTVLIPMICILILLTGSAAADKARIPAKTTIIEAQAFYGDTSLDEVVLPENLQRIESKAFAYSSVKRIYLPESLNYIAPDAFQGCTTVGWGKDKTYASDYFDSKSNLTFERDEYPEETPKEYFSFSDNGDGTCTLTEYSGTEMDVVIPRTNEEGLPVTHIGYQAFSGKGINSVYMPDTVIRLGWNAFNSCSYLTDIHLSKGLTSTEPYDGGGSVFAGCTSLTEIDIPASVKTIGEDTFRGCSNLTTVTLHEGLTNIGADAFKYCNNMGELVLPRSMQSIGAYALRDCGFTDIIIPDTVKSIGEYAFYNCDGLTGIEIPDSVLSIGDYAFSECDALVSMELSDNLTSIGKYAFYDSKSLASLTIPDKVRSIGESAFYNCSSLAAIDLPAGMTTVNSHLFYGCKSLAYVDIPDTVTGIGDNAFSGCILLAAADLPAGLKTISNYAFSGDTSLSGINIPNGTTTIGDYAFLNCSSMTTIDLADSITSIGRECFGGCSALISIEWPAKTKTLSSNVLRNCTSLTEVILHNQVAGIGEDAFYGCSSLYTVSIPSSMVTIGTKAFYGSGIVSISIPDNILSIGEYCFSQCEKLTEIQFATNLNSIGAGAFSNCPLLNHVTLPSGLTTLASNLFYNCDGLTDITIPDTVKTIGESCFNDCIQLAEITIPSGVQSIGKSAFAYNHALKKAVIPASVTSIGNNAFTGCNQLTIYGVPGSAAETEAGKYDNVQFHAISGTNPESETASIRGSVLTYLDVPVPAVTVCATAQDNPNHVLASARTDTKGAWTLNGVPVGQTYRIQYFAGSYTIEPESQNVRLAGDTSLGSVRAFADSENSQDLGISFTMKRNGQEVTEAATGEEVTFTVQAANADYVRLIVDGIPYETTAMPAGADTVDVVRKFNKAGDGRSIQFQAGNGEGWGTISNAQTLRITAGEDLAPAVFITAQDSAFDITDEVTIAWEAVSNATGYAIDLYYEGTHLWEPDDVITETSIQIPDSVLKATGHYSIDVIAVGAGYSQSTSGLAFTVTSKNYPLSILTPHKGDRFITEDTLYITVNNQEQGYVIVTVTDENGRTVILPEEGTLSGQTCEVYYDVPGHGAYTIQAFASPKNERFAPEHARASSTAVSIFVDGATVSDVQVGNGMAYQFINNARALKAITNNAVDSVEVYEGDELLDTLAYEEENYRRTFHGQARAATEGFHKYLFKATDEESDTVADRGFGFYAISEYTGGDIYPKSNNVAMTKGITAKSELLKTLAISDRVQIWGKLNEYYYVQCGDLYGFVKKAEMGSTPVNTLSGIYLRLVSPEENRKEYKQSGHKVPVRIDTDFDLPESMKYKATVMTSGTSNPTVYTFDLGRQKTGGVLTDGLTDGDYTIQVSIVNTEDESISYASTQSVPFHLYPDYDTYQYFQSYNPMNDFTEHVKFSANVVRQNQAAFTTGGEMDDGTIFKVDIESMTNAEIRAAVAIATGNYAENVDLNIVQAAYLADLFMRRMSSRNGSGEIAIDAIKDLFEYLGVESDAVNIIYEYILKQPYAGQNPLKRVLRNGQYYIQWDKEGFSKAVKDLKNDHNASEQFGKALEGIGYALQVLNTASKVIDALIVYNGVSNTDINMVAPLLQASGYGPLQDAAGMLKDMRTTTGKITFIAISIVGKDLVTEVVEKKIQDCAMKGLQKLAGSGPAAAFLIGCEIGGKIGTTINNTFLNIDGTYQAAYKTQWCADAAEKFYFNVFTKKAEAFYADPVNKRGEMMKASYVYTELTADIYAAFGKVYEELDKAWVNQISNWFTHDNKNEQGAKSCASLATMMRNYMDHCLSDETYRLYANAQ